jgi:hypothetical protein
VIETCARGGTGKRGRIKVRVGHWRTFEMLGMPDPIAPVFTNSKKNYLLL